MEQICVGRIRIPSCTFGGKQAQTATLNRPIKVIAMEISRSFLSGFDGPETGIEPMHARLP
jgi:hypothetical protein